MQKIVGRNNELFAYISLVITMVLYSSTFLAMKVVLTGYTPIEMMMFRMILSSILFLPFFFTTYKNLSVKPSDFKFLLFMTLCEPCLYFVFEGFALKYTTSGQAGIVNSLEPVFITIGAFWILKEKVPRIAFWGFFVAIFGSIVLSLGSSAGEAAPRPALGNTLELIAIALTAANMVTTKYLMTKYPPFYLAGVSILGGGVFFTALNFFFHGKFLPTFDISLLIIVYLAILTIVAYALYNYAFCVLPSHKAGPFIYLNPMLAVIFGWFFLGETLNLVQIFACVVIFLGIYLSQKSGQRRIKKITVNVMRSRIYSKVVLKR